MNKMTYKSTRCFAMLCAIVLCASPALARNVWVSNGGGGRGDGSQSKPFQSISVALKHVGAGDTVIVREGVYYENPLNVPAGDADAVITLRGEENADVTISGLIPIRNWKRIADGLLVAQLPFEVTRVVENQMPGVMSRIPNQGWWSFSDVDAEQYELVDDGDLNQVAGPVTGQSIWTWYLRGNRFGKTKISDVDPKNGSMRIDSKDSRSRKSLARINPGDMYFLRNDPSLIDVGGEWASVKTGPERYNITYKPRHESGDASGVIEARPVTNKPLITLGSHTRIENISVVGSGNYGLSVRDSKNVVIEKCAVYGSRATGVSVTNASDVVIRHSLVMDNSNGILFKGARNCQVENCDVSWNYEDGLLITFESEDIHVSGNYFHDHMLWGHPDHSQIYRGAKRIVYENNLFLTGGQGLMMEQVDDITVRGNVFMGAAANLVLFGHDSANNAVVENNSFLYPGYASLTLTGHNHELRSNLFLNGGFFGLSKHKIGYTGNHNLFWRNTPRPMFNTTKSGRHQSLSDFQESSGQDSLSVYQDPNLNNAPRFMSVLDSRKIRDSTHATLFIRGGASGFSKGDWVEVNSDGTPRRVVGVTADAIKIDPELGSLPIKWWLIYNWGKQDVFGIDIRSSREGSGNTGRISNSYGSELRISDYRRGDFDGDGVRDIPSPPVNLMKIMNYDSGFSVSAVPLNPGGLDD